MAKKNKLMTFSYTGMNGQGEYVHGQAYASSEAQARRDLIASGVRVLKLWREWEWWPFDGWVFGESKRISARRIVLFSRHLETLYKSGIPLAEVIHMILQGEDNQAMAELLNDIKLSLAAGHALSDALRKHPAHFDAFFIAMVEAGEHSGTLSTTLGLVAEHKERLEALKHSLRSAIAYPVTVVFVAFAVTVVLMVYVVPEFDAVFKSFGGELPVFTQMVIGVSGFFQDHWLPIFSLPVALLSGLGFAKKQFPEVGYRLDKLALKLPLLGKVLALTAIARFARTVSIVYGAGATLPDALRISADTTGNAVYRQAVLGIRDAVNTGHNLTESMRGTKLFPGLALQLVGNGEKSGTLDAMLAKLATLYEADIEAAVSLLKTLLEPVTIVVLGLIIGFVIIAMYLPIFKIGGAV